MLGANCTASDGRMRNGAVSHGSMHHFESLDMVTVPGCFLGCGTASLAWEGQLPGAASWRRALEAAPYPSSMDRSLSQIPRAVLGSSVPATMSISHPVSSLQGPARRTAVRVENLVCLKAVGVFIGLFLEFCMASVLGTAALQRGTRMLHLWDTHLTPP